MQRGNFSCSHSPLSTTIHLKRTVFTKTWALNAANSVDWDLARQLWCVTHVHMRQHLGIET